MNNELTRAAASIPINQMIEINDAIDAEKRRWSILLTSANHGTVGPLGSTFPHAGEKHERVQVVEIVEAGTPPAPGVDLAGLIRFDAAGNQVLLGRPDPAVVAAPVQPVGEFQGYVDGEPFVAWADRTRMPQVGDKLYAGAAPVAAQAGEVAVSEGSMADHDARFAIDAAIMFGREGVNRPPTDDHWLFEYWNIGQQLAQLGATSGWDNVTPIAAAGQVAVPEWVSVDEAEPLEGELVAARYWPYDNHENPQAVTGMLYIDGTFFTDEGDEAHPPSHWCRLPVFDAAATAQASTAGGRQEGCQ